MTEVNLGSLGIGYRELAWLAEMLTELAEKGEIDRTQLSLDDLWAFYAPLADDLRIGDNENSVSYKSWKEGDES